jgi:hypothetical protein
MISLLLLVISLIALLQFGVAYCRSVIAIYSECEVSLRTRTWARIPDETLRAEDFPLLVNLIRVCPHPGDDSARLLAVRLYYRVLRAIALAGNVITPRLSAWTRTEQASCAHFAAVTLDRRIASEA